MINHILIHLTDPELFRCPFVMMTEPEAPTLTRLKPLPCVTFC